jgi:hypothetical protein
MNVQPNKSKQGINFIDEDNSKVISNIIVKNLVWDGGWTEIYSATIDLKGFIKGFAAHLATNKDLPFTDALGNVKSGDFIEGYSASSEFPKPGAHLTRGKDYFEKKFTWAKYPGYNEIELVWEARTKSKFSQWGWIHFKMDFSCRVIKDVEVVENGQKKIMQQGSWEFRNTLTYYNSYVRDVLWKTPFVKTSPELQRLMIDHVYLANLERDFDFMKVKVKPLIWNYLYSTFRQ